MQGQEIRNKMLADQRAQQQADQVQQLNALKIKGYETEMADKARAEKAAAFRDGLLRAPTPQFARELIKAQYADPDLGPMLAKTIPLENALSEIPDDIESFDKYKMQESMGAQEYAKMNAPKVVGNAVFDPVTRSFITPPTTASPKLVPVIGPDGAAVLVPADQAAGMTPLTAATAKSKGIGVTAPSRVSGGGVSKTSGGAGDVYSREGAKLAGKQDYTLVASAPALQASLGKVDETLNILRQGDINTGLGAEWFTVMDRARSQFINDKKAGKRVEDTQYLDALLGSEVFPLIQQLGIGARGMDTPAEREFLRQVMTGTINLDKNTLIRMAELRKQALVDQATRYNERLDRGELDKIHSASNRTKQRIEIPGSKPTPAVPQAAIAIPRAAIDALKAGRGTDEQFDAIFGAGAAKRVRGQ